MEFFRYSITKSCDMSDRPFPFLLPLGLLSLRKLQIKGLNPTVSTTNYNNPLKSLNSKRKAGYSEMIENILD